MAVKRTRTLSLNSEQVSQTFRARLFLILRVAGGAEDEHLVKEYDGFPLDTNGVPTFRPSARWYLVKPICGSNHRQCLLSSAAKVLALLRARPPLLPTQNQISFSNGRSIETQESKVTAAENDLQLIKLTPTRTLTRS